MEHKNFTTNTTLEEVQMDPAKFGAPTFAEFVQNYDKWRAQDRSEDSFASIDAGSKLLGKYVVTHKYEIFGYKCKSLEEVERVAKLEGINKLDQLQYTAELIPHAGLKCDLLVKFFKKGTGNEGVKADIP